MWSSQFSARPRPPSSDYSCKLVVIRADAVFIGIHSSPPTCSNQHLSPCAYGQERFTITVHQTYLTKLLKRQTVVSSVDCCGCVCVVKIQGRKLKKDRQVFLQKQVSRKWELRLLAATFRSTSTMPYVQTRSRIPKEGGPNKNHFKGITYLRIVF